MEAGSPGGRWQVIDEIPNDPQVIQQENRLACTAACAEMLLRDRDITGINQTMIFEASEEIPNQRGRNLSKVAEVMNCFTPSDRGMWRGGFIFIESNSDNQLLRQLTETGSWMAEFRSPGDSIAHAVVVDRFEAQTQLLIRDPWEGSSYKMEKSEFFKYWTGRAVFLGT